MTSSSGRPCHAASLRMVALAGPLWLLPWAALEASQAGAPDRGREVYEQRCSLCHGESGRGDGRMAKDIVEPPPFDLTRSTSSDEYMAWIVRRGGEAMGALMVLERMGDAALRRRIHRVAWELFTKRLPPTPDPSRLPTSAPDLVRPRLVDGPARITWVGHATTLIQLPGLNVLTDPVWSDRASPLAWSGPKRLVPAIPRFRDLPPIDAVLLSHDHYDHLDRSTVRAIQLSPDCFSSITPVPARARPKGSSPSRRRIGTSSASS